MDDLFSDKQVEEFADKVVGSITTKVKSQIADAFYDEMRDYLYEHYDNNKSRVEGSLIDMITEQFVKNPTDYKFDHLRKKLFDENKDALTKVLTDEAIKDSVEKVILDYTHKSYYFEWRWKEEIVRIILKNWDLFKDDERIKASFGRELDHRQDTINSLRQRLVDAGVDLDY